MTEGVRTTIQKRDSKGDIRHGGEWLALWSDPKSMQTDAEKRADATSESLLNNAQTAIAASLRTLAENPNLEVRFSRTPKGFAGVSLSPLEMGKTSIAALRGEADAKASYLRHHDSQLHTQMRPQDNDEARLFDLIEQSRCEGLVGQRMPGVSANLTAHHLARLAKADLLNAHLASLIPLSEGLRMVLRDKFTGASEPSIQTAGMRMWSQWMQARFSDQLDRLYTCLPIQENFALAATDFLEALFLELPSKGHGNKRRKLSPTPEGEGNPDPQTYFEGDNLTRAELFEPGEDSDLDPGSARNLLSSTDQATPYRTYTTRHDRVVNASDLFDQVMLSNSRHKLDERRSEYRQEILRLSGRLQRRLMAQQARRWEFDTEEGLIDASRLDRVVTAPGFSTIFKQEAQSPFLNTLVTLLIDNSGSMRGKSVETACVVTDILAAALERCGVAIEILGFTTRNWKGGLSAKDWKQAGREEDPGRLNDILHIIYKDADTPLRRARDCICAMLEPSLLKENIDGEALSWAAGRMLRRTQARRLLIVISDGSPVDQATLDVNSDKRLLDRHLRDVVDWIKRTTSIDLAAIGIKHDVGNYYDDAVRIDDVSELGVAVIDLIDKGIARHS